MVTQCIKSRLAIRLLVGAGLVLAVSACGSDGVTSTVNTPPAAPQENQFGSAFATDYRASANSEPANANDGDIVAVSLTTEPVAVN